MPSPVPRHLRTHHEEAAIPLRLRDHVDTLVVRAEDGTGLDEVSSHPAKYAPGLPTALVKLAGTDDLGDPMCGTGRLAEETRLPVSLNDLDPKWRSRLAVLNALLGCRVSSVDASAIAWSVDTFVFSPPYYPRTDRRRNAAHDDAKRGSVVGFRTGYDCELSGFVGEPAGVNGILTYRNAMRRIFLGLRGRGKRMILVTKNTTRLGTELRLDLDTILTAAEAGWKCVARTGWTPKPSLWQRYNAARNTAVLIEDVLVFDLAV